jgi:septum formation inhibitor-activating ATPase MinD
MINEELQESQKNKENILVNDKYSSEDLNNIKLTIEKMDKVHHIEILKILITEESNYINENNNGTFVNLSDLKNSSIKKLKDYIIYFNKQQNQLINLENQKKKIENLFCN